MVNIWKDGWYYLDIVIIKEELSAYRGMLSLWWWCNLCVCGGCGDSGWVIHSYMHTYVLTNAYVCIILFHITEYFNYLYFISFFLSWGVVYNVATIILLIYNLII